MQMTPVIAVHMTAALLAVAAGPVALWARRGREQRPRLHRAFGYAWVTLMLVTAVSALFIRDFRLPNVAGYTPIHLLVPVVFISLFGAFWMLARGNIGGHRRIMQRLYFAACIVAGAFTLLPSRYLGGLVWGTLGPVLGHTPVWVWGLLAALVALGALQLRDRSASLLRVSLTPIAMTVFSLWGTVSLMNNLPAISHLTAWMAAATIVFLLLASGPAPATYDAATRSYRVQGSVVPLLLMLAVFAVKYVAGVQMALDPRRLYDLGYTLTLATVYGAFSGAFLGRAARLWRLALPQPLATFAA
jgi:uncharacterized membrane protein